jgi:hypothetical protein
VGFFVFIHFILPILRIKDFLKEKKGIKNLPVICWKKPMPERIMLFYFSLQKLLRKTEEVRLHLKNMPVFRKIHLTNLLYL